MRWINIGTLYEFNVYEGEQLSSDTTSQTGVSIKLDTASNAHVIKALDNEVEECWASFDMVMKSAQNTSSNGFTWGFDNNNSALTNTIPSIILFPNGWTLVPKLGHITWNSSITNQTHTVIYEPDVTWDFSDGKAHNIEIHVKTGDSGRIDVWFDHKLSFSYRSPSAFQDMKISYFKIIGYSFFHSYYSSFIIQDTRRIGYEKFVKLTIDPSTEQNMAQGTTTNFTLSGLTDSSEYSDITSVVAVLQATSRDANISTGTYTLDGADVGTIDVSDSSGKAYETAHTETNSVTGLPWTRDDIEGKTLSFTVNGAE